MEGIGDFDEMMKAVETEVDELEVAKLCKSSRGDGVNDCLYGGLAIDKSELYKRSSDCPQKVSQK